MTKINRVLGIVRYYANRGCPQCIALLKSGLGNQPKPARSETNPVTSRISND